MVVIGKHSPGFELPAAVLECLQQAALDHFKTLAAYEVMGFLISACRDKVGSAGCETMRRGMRPCDDGLGHGEDDSQRSAGRKDFGTEVKRGLAGPAEDEAN